MGVPSWSWRATTLTCWRAGEQPKQAAYSQLSTEITFISLHRLSIGLVSPFLVPAGFVDPPQHLTSGWATLSKLFWCQQTAAIDELVDRLTGWARAALANCFWSTIFSPTVVFLSRRWAAKQFHGWRRFRHFYPFRLTTTSRVSWTEQLETSASTEYELINILPSLLWRSRPQSGGHAHKGDTPTWEELNKDEEIRIVHNHGETSIVALVDQDWVPLLYTMWQRPKCSLLQLLLKGPGCSCSAPVDSLMRCPNHNSRLFPMWKSNDQSELPPPPVAGVPHLISKAESGHYMGEAHFSHWNSEF